MNKKTVLAVGLCVVLLVCSVIYFRPLPLSSCIPENGSLLLHSNTFGVQNGKPYIHSLKLKEISYIHSEAYDHITEDQKEKIMELAQAYTYNRTLKTYLSDGAMENSGSKVLSIHMIDKDAVVGAIYVSEAGRISINDRPYKMKNAKQFQEQLEAILKE